MFFAVLSVYPFLEINFLLQGAICFLLLSLHEAYRSQPTAESRTKYFSLFFGVVLINRISLFYSPAVQPHWHTAVAAWDTDRGVAPLLKQWLKDSQIAACRAVFQTACLPIASLCDRGVRWWLRELRYPEVKNSISEVSLVIVEFRGVLYSAHMLYVAFIILVCTY